MAGNPNEEISQEFQKELNRLAEKALTAGTKHIKESVAGLIEASRQFGYDTTDLLDAVRSGDEQQTLQCVLNIHKDTSAYAKAGKEVVRGIQRDCNLYQNEVAEDLENNKFDNLDEKQESFTNDLAVNQEVVKTSTEKLQQQLNETKQELTELKEWKENRLPERTKRAVNNALDNAITVVVKVGDAIDNSFNKAKDFVKSIGSAIKEKGKAAANSIKKGWVGVKIGFVSTDKALWNFQKKADELVLKFDKWLHTKTQDLVKGRQEIVNFENHNVKRLDDKVEQLKAAKAAIGSGDDTPGNNDLGDDALGDDEGIEI